MDSLWKVVWSIPGNHGYPMNESTGKQRRHGTRIARGEVRLCGFVKPDKKRPVIVLTRGTAVSLGCDGSCLNHWSAKLTFCQTIML